MQAGDVLRVVGTLETARLWHRLDGGWGVDALVGRATRRHEDLDLVVARADLPAVVQALAPLGFSHDHMVEPGLPARVVLRAAAGCQVDLHPVVFDERGDGLQELGGGEWGRYPAEGLEGVGEVRGHPVRCLTAELQLAHHDGDEQNEQDRHDVALLQSLLTDA